MILLMTGKRSYLTNPITGLTIFKPASPISGILFIFLTIYLVRESKDTKDSSYIMSHKWIADKGYTIGDTINFSIPESYKVQDQIIYKKDEPVAIVINVERVIWGKNKMQIISVQNKEVGYYFEE